MAPIIRTEKLTHLFGAGTPFERAAVTEVDFAAEKGEFIGVMGHTGSGKSTFIQHLNGILKPTSGRVLLDGEDINATKASVRKARFRVGLVFQYPEYQLFEETVEKDIAFGPKNMGLSDEEVRERVREAAAFVELPEGVFQKSPFELSGGQKRRTAIAGVIAMKPEVLILDEPTAGLDPVGRKTLLRHIRAYRDKTNAAVIMVSHSMDELAECASRIVVLNGGRLVLDGDARSVFARGEELKGLGLDVPHITRIALMLRGMGLPLDASVRSVQEAADAIAALKGGGRGA